MAAAYAGRLSSLDPFRSPSHKNINGILGLELLFSETEVTTLTLGRVSPVTKFQSMGFLIRNGLTTSADPTFSQISNRRLTDQIIRGLTEIFTPLVSEPNNADLAQQLATGADAFLGRLSEPGSQGGAALENYSIQVHASALDKLARQVFVDVAFLQNGPADYIRLRLKPSDASLAVETNPA
jgi:phage tail sheath protein FI